MRVGSTGPVIYLTGQSRKVTGQTCLDMYLGWLVGPWSPVLFPGCRALCIFYPHCLQHYNVVCARKMRKRPQPTHGQLATPVALDHRFHPTSDLTSELVIYAVSAPGKQPSWAASGSKPTTGAVDLPAGAAIREDALPAAGACCSQCCCCCCCCCCCFDDDCSCCFKFGHISYWYDNSRAT